MGTTENPEILTRTSVTNQKSTGGGQDQSGRFRVGSGEEVLQVFEIAMRIARAPTDSREINFQLGTEPEPRFGCKLFGIQQSVHGGGGGGLMFLLLSEMASYRADSLARQTCQAIFSVCPERVLDIRV